MHLVTNASGIVDEVHNGRRAEHGTMALESTRCFFEGNPCQTIEGSYCSLLVIAIRCHDSTESRWACNRTLLPLEDLGDLAPAWDAKETGVIAIF